MKRLFCILALLSVWLVPNQSKGCDLVLGGCSGAVAVQQPALAFSQQAVIVSQPSFGFAVAAPFVNVGIGNPFFGFNSAFIGVRRGFVAGGGFVGARGLGFGGARSVRQVTRTRIR